MYFTLLVFFVLRHPEGARNYTHMQAARRVFRMRSSRRPSIPQDIHELAGILNNPQYPNYSRTFQTPPSTFFQEEIFVNGMSVGLVFANRDAIAKYQPELNTATLVGVDGTFKTVPSYPPDLDCLFTFQVLFKNVVSNCSHCQYSGHIVTFYFLFQAFPMVYVLLGSKTEETYCAVLTIIRQILPLNYDRIRFITDYEKGLMNAVTRIFPTSRLQCCWFHYTQVIF